MKLGYFFFGVLILVLVVLDILWTTIWVEGGAGPLTGRLMALTWRLVRRAGQRSPHLLTLSGPLILGLSLTAWIVLLWASWTLIFASAENALIDTLGRGPVSWSDLLYFTGYTVFTLGNGDFAPRGSVWQIASVLVSGSGLLFVTLIVTYVLSVLGAVTQKRPFASNVSGLGAQSDDIVRTSWNGEAFEGIDVPLNTLATQLNTLTSNHKAYPIVHYFHSGGAGQAPAHNITVLDEALTLLRFGVAEDARPHGPVLRSARSSVENYLGTLHDAFVEPADRSPPPLDLTVLRDEDIPTVPDKSFATAQEDLDHRRRLLLGLVESDERQWPTEADE